LRFFSGVPARRAIPRPWLGLGTADELRTLSERRCCQPMTIHECLQRG
jgi:hypothetical protein